MFARCHVHQTCGPEREKEDRKTPSKIHKFPSPFNWITAPFAHTMSRCMPSWCSNFVSFMDHDHVILALYNLGGGKPFILVMKTEKTFPETKTDGLFYSPFRSGVFATLPKLKKTAHKHENAMNAFLLHRQQPRRVSYIQHLHKREKWKRILMNENEFPRFSLLLSAIVWLKWMFTVLNGRRRLFFDRKPTEETRIDAPQT